MTPDSRPPTQSERRRRILYLSSSYVPSRRASSVQVMKMCSALARRGHEVELVTKLTPQRTEGSDDPFVFYGLGRDFEITPLRRPAVRGGGLVWAAEIRRHLGRRRAWCDLAFCRDPVAAWLAARLAIPVQFEAHHPPIGRLELRLWRRMLAAPSFSGLVVISHALADELRARGIVSTADRMLVAPDGADASLAELDAGESGAERATGPHRLQLGYVGHLYPGRGLRLLTAIAAELPECTLHVVGGNDDDIAVRRATAPPNMTFHGFVAPARLKDFYRRFDVLLMPYQLEVGVASGSANTVDWMSPMKMFEYMATGRAIVSSDLPVLREVLEDGRNARLAAPNAVEQWVAIIRELDRDQGQRTRLGLTARREFLEHYTWERRAEAIESSWAGMGLGR